MTVQPVIQAAMPARDQRPGTQTYLPRAPALATPRRDAKTSLSRLVDPHVPLDQAAHLARGIAAREHALHEFVVLGLGIGVLLRLEADDGQEVLDLGEHPLLDDAADFLVGRPGGVFAFVLRAITEREL